MMVTFQVLGSFMLGSYMVGRYAHSYELGLAIFCFLYGVFRWLTVAYNAWQRAYWFKESK